MLCPQASGWGLSGFHASWSPIQASTRVGSVDMSRTRGSAGRINSHRVPVAQVDMAIADRKKECRTADQFDCGEIFSCNSDSSKSTEAFGNSLARGSLAVTNNAKTNQVKMFKTELTNLQNESPTSLHLALTQWLPTLDRTGYQLAGQKFCPRVRAIGARYRLPEGFHFLSGCHAHEVLLVALRTFNHQINALRYSVLHACTSTSKLDSRLGPEHTVHTLRARGTSCAGVQILFCACRSLRRAVVLVTSHRLNCPAISSSSIPNRSPVFQKLDEHIQAYLYVNYRRTAVTFGNDGSQPTGNCTNGSVGSELSALS
jgi:hypothetical protein